MASRHIEYQDLIWWRSLLWPCVCLAPSHSDAGQQQQAEFLEMVHQPLGMGEGSFCRLLAFR